MMQVIHLIHNTWNSEKLVYMKVSCNRELKMYQFAHFILVINICWNPLQSIFNNQIGMSNKAKQQKQQAHGALWESLSRKK